MLCGVGGQGTVLAAKVLAAAAIAEGEEVKTTETIGMAQRGGSVVSHVRVGKDVASPLIPLREADMIIAFEPGEAVRNLPYLKAEGTVICSSKAVKPVTVALSGSTYDGKEMLSYLKDNVKKLIVVDGEKICQECGSSKVLNVALLGASSKEFEGKIKPENIKHALFARIPERFVKMNEQAFSKGEAQ